MTISVVVPAYNEENYIESCLDSIFDQEVLPDEVIVVDNNSRDKTVELAKAYPVRIIKEKTQGMIPARNAGFNAATGDIIARTDADSIVPRDWIKKIKKHFQDKELMGLSGPAHFDKVPDIVQAYHWPNVIALNKTFRQFYHHDCMFGPNMVLRRTVWEKIKDKVCMNDKDVHEDVDIAIHLGKVGKIKFDPRLVIISSPRRWTKIDPYVEYPYRYFKTLQRHHELLSKIKQQTLTQTQKGTAQFNKFLEALSLKEK